MWMISFSLKFFVKYASLSFVITDYFIIHARIQERTYLCRIIIMKYNTPFYHYALSKRLMGKGKLKLEYGYIHNPLS